MHHLMLEETGNKPYEATQQCDLLLTGQVVHCCVQACSIKSESFLQPLCQVGEIVMQNCTMPCWSRPRCIKPTGNVTKSPVCRHRSKTSECGDTQKEFRQIVRKKSRRNLQNLIVRKRNFEENGALHEVPEFLAQVNVY